MRELYGWILVIAIALGIVTGMGFYFSNLYIESWKNMTPDKSSCDELENTITRNHDKIWFDEVSPYMKALWDKMDCNNLTSEHWKGQKVIAIDNVNAILGK